MTPCAHQLEILRHIANGKTNEEIAVLTGTTLGSVCHHIRWLTAVTNAANRASLVRIAYEARWLKVPDEPLAVALPPYPRRSLPPTNRREVSVASKCKVQMGKRMGNLFEALSRSRGHIATRDYLVDATWGTNTRDVSMALNCQISKLRNALKGTGLGITCYRGVGYQLVEGAKP